MKPYGPVFSYKQSVPASGERDAYEKLLKLMKANPELFLVGARDLTVPRNKPLWKRLLTG